MNKFLVVVLLISNLGFSQIPQGYYNTANGLTGFALKTELKNIIKNGHTAQGYGALLTLYTTSDNDDFYDNGSQTNTILDLYSENPAGPDAYNYQFNDNCGNVGSNEGVCYNREHIFPQGFFSSTQNPIPREDAHHVIPTDGRINGVRESFPFGMVANSGSTFTSLNGSKRGTSITPGFTGTVFEPIDEFKGDVARMLLYFATRYEDEINDAGWDNPSASINNPRDGSANRFYEQWYIDLLLDWHQQDPVSLRELERNNAIFIFQGNRNPYIDNPQWVTQIWSSTASVTDASLSLVSLYPVPSNGTVFLSNTHLVEKAVVYNTNGTLIATYDDLNSGIEINRSGLYFIRLHHGNTTRTIKLIIN